MFYTSDNEWATICRQTCAQAIGGACRLCPPTVLAHLPQDCARHRQPASRPSDGFCRLRPSCFPEPPKAVPGRLRRPRPDWPQRFPATTSLPGDPVMGRFRSCLTDPAVFLRSTRGYFSQLPSAPPHDPLAEMGAEPVDGVTGGAMESATGPMSVSPLLRSVPQAGRRVISSRSLGRSSMRGQSAIIATSWALPRETGVGCWSK